MLERRELDRENAGEAMMELFLQYNLETFYLLWNLFVMYKNSSVASANTIMKIVIRILSYKYRLIFSHKFHSLDH